MLRTQLTFAGPSTYFEFICSTKRVAQQIHFPLFPLYKPQKPAKPSPLSNALYLVRHVHPLFIIQRLRVVL